MFKRTDRMFLKLMLAFVVICMTNSVDARVSGAPDIIMIEGFGNFIHDTSDGNDLAKILNGVLDGINEAELCGTDGDEDSRLTMAKVYWCGFLYGIPGFNGSTAFLDVYQSADSNQRFSGKIGYLHWDSGYRIGRSDNGINASQLYDNYDCFDANGNFISGCSGSEGLVTRFNRLLNGTHGQSQALNHSFCQANGCILISHSTGGTVMDVLLAEAYQNDGYTGFTNQGIAVGNKGAVYGAVNYGLQIASAAGGVGLAQYLVDVLNGASCGSDLKSTLANSGITGMALDVLTYIAEALFVDWQCGLDGSEGAGHDLKNSYARQGGNTYGSRSDYGGTPILMIAGTGTIVDLSEHNGIITSHLESTGLNDGLVALHSACGANVQAGYDSCHKHLSVDGWVGNYSAPVGDGEANTWNNHYPFLMTEEGHISQVYKNGTIEFVTDTLAEIFTFGFANTDIYEILVPDSDWDQYYEVGNPWNWEINDRIEDRMTGAVVTDSTDPLRDRGYGDFKINVPEYGSSSEDPDYFGCNQWWGLDCTKEVYRLERVYLADYTMHLSELLGRKLDTRLTSTDISEQH